MAEVVQFPHRHRPRPGYTEDGHKIICTLPPGQWSTFYFLGEYTRESLPPRVIIVAELGTVPVLIRGRPCPVPYALVGVPDVDSAETRKAVAEARRRLTRELRGTSKYSRW
jgi:hypothetical protein